MAEEQTYAMTNANMFQCMEDQAKTMKALEAANVRLKNERYSASSQALIALTPFEDPWDYESLRAINGWARAFGMDSLASIVHGENLLIKFCLLASPPTNNPLMTGMVKDLLAVADEVEIDFDMVAGEESEAKGKRAIDIICNNKGKDGVKPDILKMLLEKRASVNAGPPGGGKAPIIAAAGTANLACVKVLVAARADLTVSHNGANLAYY
jgi:hypothetical protein